MTEVTEIHVPCLTSYIPVETMPGLEYGALVKLIGANGYHVRPIGHRQWFVARMSPEYSAGDDEVLRTITDEINDYFVGRQVEAGEGDDHDVGRVERIESPTMAFVAWGSGVETPAPIADLRLL